MLNRRVPTELLHYDLNVMEKQVRLRNPYLELMGRHSNIFLISADGMIYDAVRRKPDGESSLRTIMPGEKYINPPDQGKVDPWTFSRDEALTELRLLPPQTALWKWIQDSFQGFSKTAAQEVVRRWIAISASK